LFVLVSYLIYFIKSKFSQSVFIVVSFNVLHAKMHFVVHLQRKEKIIIIAPKTFSSLNSSLAIHNNIWVVATIIIYSMPPKRPSTHQIFIVISLDRFLERVENRRRLCDWIVLHLKIVKWILKRFVKPRKHNRPPHIETHIIFNDTFIEFYISMLNPIFFLFLCYILHKLHVMFSNILSKSYRGIFSWLFSFFFVI